MSKSDIKFVPKGWGYEKWICNTSEYCGKLLFFAKGKRCSWHYHLLKDETFFLQSGKIHLFYGFDNDIALSDSIVLEPGDNCLLYTSPSPRDRTRSRMPSSA